MAFILSCIRVISIIKILRFILGRLYQMAP
jgi:hypothetical protein